MTISASSSSSPPASSTRAATRPPSSTTMRPSTEARSAPGRTRCGSARPAEQQPEAGDDHGLSGAGLTGHHVEARGQLENGLLDHPEVLDPHFLDHGPHLSNPSRRTAQPARTRLLRHSDVSPSARRLRRTFVRLSVRVHGPCRSLAGRQDRFFAFSRISLPGQGLAGVGGPVGAGGVQSRTRPRQPATGRPNLVTRRSVNGVWCRRASRTGRVRGAPRRGHREAPRSDGGRHTTARPRGRRQELHRHHRVRRDHQRAARTARAR